MNGDKILLKLILFFSSPENEGPLNCICGVLMLNDDPCDVNGGVLWLSVNENVSTVVGVISTGLQRTVKFV